MQRIGHRVRAHAAAQKLPCRTATTAVDARNPIRAGGAAEAAVIGIRRGRDARRTAKGQTLGTDELAEPIDAGLSRRAGGTAGAAVASAHGGVHARDLTGNDLADLKRTGRTARTPTAEFTGGTETAATATVSDVARSRHTLTVATLLADRAHLRAHARSIDAGSADQSRRAGQPATAAMGRIRSDVDTPLAARHLSERALERDARWFQSRRHVRRHARKRWALG